MLALELQRLGFRCWVDNLAEDLTKEGMRSGIEHAHVFLLFLSKGVLSRPFVQASAVVPRVHPPVHDPFHPPRSSS